MKLSTVYRLGIVKRSRHIGVAILRGTTLVCFATRRQTGRRTCDVSILIRRFHKAYVLDEIVSEEGAIAPLDRRPVHVRLHDATKHLLPAHPRPTRNAMVKELLRRYPSLRPHRKLTRDRIVALYAVALALTRATITSQPFQSHAFSITQPQR